MLIANKVYIVLISKRLLNTILDTQYLIFEKTVMENVADRNGKFPTDDCLLFVTQREIRSQEFLLRQQCKSLEVAEPLFEAVLNYCRNLSGERDLHFAKVIEG